VLKVLKDSKVHQELRELKVEQVLRVIACLCPDVTQTKTLPVNQRGGIVLPPFIQIVLRLLLIVELFLIVLVPNVLVRRVNGYMIVILPRLGKLLRDV